MPTEMPKLDGFGVLTALRRDPRTAAVPFIFLTAKGVLSNPGLVRLVRVRPRHCCSIIVVPSSFACATFCLPPPGQVISSSSNRSALPRPIVTGNSDCDR